MYNWKKVMIIKYTVVFDISTKFLSSLPRSLKTYLRVDNDSTWRTCYTLKGNGAKIGKPTARNNSLSYPI